jgi:mannose-6-phosphate isomerase-like protein (cupin superfamily)
MSDGAGAGGLSRRGLIVGQMALAAAAAQFGRAHGMEAAPAGGGSARLGRVLLERETDGVAQTVMHGGAAPIGVKFFRFDEAPQPSLLITYLIPPGASEGVHTHRRGDRALGGYEEFYYVLEGAGVMQIDGQELPVAAGDHVFVPLGVAHGVRNASPRETLKIFLTAVDRG